MKYIIIIIGLMFLAGCNTIPTKPKFPKPPEELMVPAPPLKTIRSIP